jgi:hypothetical protein
MPETQGATPRLNELRARNLIVQVVNEMPQVKSSVGIFWDLLAA